MKVLLTITLAFIAIPDAAAETKRPNVVLIITDDQNDYALAESGVQVITPHLDKLKSQSIEFERAYCASPVCGPSRASLFSGLYPHNTGAYFNGADPWLYSEALGKAESLPELFRRGDYHTWGMGKLYHAKLPEDREKKQWDNKASAQGGFAPFPEEEFQFSGKFFSVKEWDGPDTDFPDVKSANAAVEFLNSYQGEKPFFLCYGLWRPHNPWTAPRRFFDLYDPQEIAFPPPGYRADDMADVPPDGKTLAAIFGNRWNKFGDTNKEAWRRIMHGYLACTSFADWNVGRVMQALDESGHGENTIILFTADNGYHLGEKHHYGKSTLWEKSARVPLFARLPGNHNSGTVCKSPVGLIDLFPTLQMTCSLPATPQTLDGHDLSPLLENPKASWPHPAITTYGEGRFSLRTTDWRYIRYPDGREELFDHRNDPNEFTNLADDPATEKLRADFIKKLPEKWHPSLGGRKG
ncbi:MAG: sulfatase [Verrucomicrobiota bacterium]